MNTEEAYQKAKFVLRNRYGDEYIVARDCIRKITDWHAVKYGDGRSLRKFSDFLNNCLTSMYNTDHLKSLDSEEQMSIILGKLPRYIVDRWSRVVDKWLHEFEQRRYPPFSVLCEFLEKEARISCNAVNLKFDQEKKGLEKSNTGKFKGARSFSTAVQQKDSYVNKTEVNESITNKSASNDKGYIPFERHGGQAHSDTVQKSNLDKRCVICNQSHGIHQCKEFSALTWEQKRDALKKRGLCFGCLDEKHLIKVCKNRQSCKICGALHPTLLHREKVQVHATSTSNTDDNDAEVEKEPDHIVTLQTDSIAEQCDGGHYNSIIIPVYVMHKDSDKRVLTYALLDEQSNSTFISKQTLENLGVTGRPTKIKLTTMLSSVLVNSQAVSGLSVVGVKSVNGGAEINLKSTYLRESIPVQRELIPRPETAAAYKHLKHLTNKLMPYRGDIEVGLLIGLDCVEAIKPRKLIPGPGNSPWAIRTGLGWGIAGVVDQVQMINVVQDKACHVAFKTHAVEISPAAVLKMFDRDFSETNLDGKISMEDKRFLEIMKTGIHRCSNGHFELPLPLKNTNITLPNNRNTVLKRLNGLKSRLLRDENYRKDYFGFMNNIMENGYAEPVPECEFDIKNGRLWYIPHHGVYHPKKPGKIRVVFDCSMEAHGEVLNKNLLQGPDQTNNLTGVLCRFRQEAVAISCDIEGMFHQVEVNEEYRNFLRFLWWKDNDLSKPPQEYRMTVHLFGATSSPGCANFALKHMAGVYESECGIAAAEFVRNDFYVDDGLKSVATEREAIELIQDTRMLCKQGGFNLHKFICNRKAVLATVPVEFLAKDVQNLDFECDALPVERTLGIEWVIESDSFQFRITLKDKPCTRRGILSTVSSVFDPLGLVSPFIMIGKRILQSVIQDKGDWDDPVPEDLKAKWEQWRLQLPDLAKIQVRRCYKEIEFGCPESVELHHFSDASLSGYGQCSYLRQLNKDGIVNCALVMGKSRVPPSKPVTVPRLELTAAVVSARIGKFLDKELVYKDLKHYYWTDSKVVLCYINNEARRFHIYIANRVQQIRDYTDTVNWKFVSTVNNPADLASRGMSARELQSSDLWWKGPRFLWENTCFTLNDESLMVLSPTDPEVKRAVVHVAEAKQEFDGLLDRLEYFSSWFRAKRAVAVCLKFFELLKAKQIKKPKQPLNGKDLKTQIRQNYEPVNVSNLQRAELVILTEVQSQVFSEELEILEKLKITDNQCIKDRNMQLKHTSCLYRLDPYVGEDGLIHVGGRIKRAEIPRNLVYPVILPRRSYVTDLIVNHYHRRTQHSGRGITLNEIRSSGFWIIKARSVVTSHIRNCVRCKRYRGMTTQQKMADLPEDRLEPVEPFTYSAVDFFGPFYVREGRSDKKRWGVIFTCMACRAVHLETANSLDTDAFINAYRRFTARRGRVQQLRSDRGTNFVGARSELESALIEIDNEKIRKSLLKDSCDWINFKMNVPHASHMAGSWERMIRTVRSVLTSLLDTHAEQLDDELLRTLLTEAEAVVNSRPITYQDLNSAESGEPLSPHQLLTMKSRIVLPPPGEFQRQDLYCRKRWRRVQYLANQFWVKWKVEYLNSLQERQKWIEKRDNLCVNDIVLVKDESTARGQWPLGRIMSVFPSGDQLTRKVTVRIGNTVYDRPVQKLIFIYRPGSPSRSHSEV